jgi:hypothetical protein
MEPLQPAVREELKRVHPDLTDADIDQYERLTSLRFTFDPAASPEEIKAIDIRREQLIREKMPRFADVVNVVSARAREQNPRIKNPPRIELRRGTDDSRDR